MLKVEKPFQAFHKLTGKVYYFGDTLQYSVHHVFVLKVQTFENQTKHNSSTRRDSGCETTQKLVL